MKYIAVFGVGVAVGILIVVAWALCAANKIDKEKDDCIESEKR